MQTRGDEAGHVRHVHHQVGACPIRDRAQARKVEMAGIRAGANNDQFGVVFLRQGFHLVVVEAFCILPDPIVLEVV